MEVDKEKGRKINEALKRCDKQGIRMNFFGEGLLVGYFRNEEILFLKAEKDARLIFGVLKEEFINVLQEAIKEEPYRKKLVRIISNWYKKCKELQKCK